MLLKDYIPNLNKKYNDVFFSGISFDSSKVKKDNIFFAIKGNKFDGNKYINKAIKKGANVIITEKKITQKKENIVFLHSPNVRKLLAEVSYKFINKRITKLIAVTGTNGKSSIAEFFYQILSLNSKKVASIGTIGVRYKDKKKNLGNTTLDPIQLSLLLKDLIDKKIDYIIMEASSHGLKQNRLDGLLFDVGIFTNLSHDHLDYHKDMNDYLNSKLYLFNKLIKKEGEIITDANIPQHKVIKSISLKKNINLSLILSKKKGIELISHKYANEKQILNIRFDDKKYEIVLDLIGKIQIKNLLMAMLAANKSGVEFKKIINISQKLKPVEGRLEKIGMIRNNSKVILDYAHTPAALEFALLNIKEQFPESKISLVFGCGGERDLKKRSLMGKIADKHSDKIYLTDDNPRNENPSKIRKDIKKGIKKTKLLEQANRKKAIHKAIMGLDTGEILLVAGKGHEKIQDYGKRKLFFSDKQIIFKSINYKNKYLSKNLKLNIIREESKSKISNKILINNISINSKMIKKNDVFFAIKGKKLDGNRYVAEAFKRKSSLAIVNQINKNYSTQKQIKVKNTLNFLTKCSSIYRENINAKIISITGSCGKTTLKEMIGFTLKKISKITYSPKSYNNKYGVPLSLFNLRQNDDFGVFEVGMDKKGEIDSLTKITKPDLGIITNISYAHLKNFKNINQIADAKAEIMNNIKKGGSIVLNRDDSFYNYHKNFALKKKLKVISFGIKNKSSMVKLVKIKKIAKKYELFFNLNGLLISFYSANINQSHLYNILATLASINIYTNIKRFKKSIFLNFKTPMGRGDISKIKLKNKKVFLVDETYNSNPLSLKIAIENYDKIESKNFKKYLILGDMRELGKHSKKQHKLVSNVVNKTKINKVYVIGKYIKETFKGLKQNKKARILNKKIGIIDLINKDLNNNDYLMIKGSNSTGLHRITASLKQRSSNAI
ncbi:UDP-N-acetylmuramoyl-L-alanyl-D-glutamate--2,6-diaminopimelate ligase [Pelagibacterales bacterium SAG-MED39]|nr:UDP-N-acetylmuramoyl-L-alanyl-D-glutamate--2,6-diaminopimelate ligase [Pelagibacterales bacterium SAG-MED39]